MKDVIDRLTIKNAKLKAKVSRFQRERWYAAFGTILFVAMFIAVELLFGKIKILVKGG